MTQTFGDTLSSQYNQVNLKDEYIETEFNFLASESAEESKTQYEIYQLKCPDNKPLYAGSGPYGSEKCHSCDETESLHMPNMYLDEYCSKICPNREIIPICSHDQLCVHVTDLSSQYKCVLKDFQEESLNSEKNKKQKHKLREDYWKRQMINVYTGE